MTQVSLKVDKREATGRDLRKLKQKGVIPAVIYGKDFGNLNIQVDKNAFIKAYRKIKETGEIELEIDSTKLKVLIKDMDIDPVYVQPVHVDFLIQGKTDKKAEDLKK